MQRVLEAIFRHRFQMILMIVVPLLVAGGIVLSMPRTYEASATLWALQRYSVIGATGPEADLSATPASTQSTALTELLQTRSFALATAKQTNLATTYSAATQSNPDTLNDALFSDISKNVKVNVIGYNVYQILYDNQHPKIAQQVVAAVVAQFGIEASQFSVVEGKQLLAIDVGQLTQAQNASDTAAKAAVSYLAKHPGSTVQNDATYSLLYAQQQSAQNSLLSLQTTIAQINRQIASVGSGSTGLYSIVDAPVVGDRPVSRSKTLLLGGGIGLALALLACSLFLVLLLRQDRSAHAPSDIQRITDLPVLLELPFVPATVTVNAINGSHATARSKRRLIG